MQLAITIRLAGRVPVKAVPSLLTTDVPAGGVSLPSQSETVGELHAFTASVATVGQPAPAKDDQNDQLRSGAPATPSEALHS